MAWTGEVTGKTYNPASQMLVVSIRLNKEVTKGEDPIFIEESLRINHAKEDDYIDKYVTSRTQQLERMDTYAESVSTGPVQETTEEESDEQIWLRDYRKLNHMKKAVEEGLATRAALAALETKLRLTSGKSTLIF